MTSSSDPTAASERDRSAALIVSVAAAVAPGSKVTLSDPDGGPRACTSPHWGEVYYTLFRTFDAPKGASGASLVPGIREELSRHGFQFQEPDILPQMTRLQGQTDTQGIMIVGDAHDRTVNVVLDTPCGRP